MMLRVVNDQIFYGLKNIRIKLSPSFNLMGLNKFFISKYDGI
jgi:hypothetical protein